MLIILIIQTFIRRTLSIVEAEAETKLIRQLHHSLEVL